jgi:hypothetical protein
MDMSRLIKAFEVFMIAASLLMCGGAMASEQIVTPQQSKPIDRGFGQGDACFGDKYEKDDDLKTGNEAAVQEALRLLLAPGS